MTDEPNGAAVSTFHLPTRCPRCDEPVWDWPGYPHTCKGISAERIRAIFREELARAEPDRRGRGAGVKP